MGNTKNVPMTNACNYIPHGHQKPLVPMTTVLLISLKGTKDSGAHDDSFYLYSSWAPKILVPMTTVFTYISHAHQLFLVPMANVFTYIPHGHNKIPVPMRTNGFWCP